LVIDGLSRPGGASNDQLEGFLNVAWQVEFRWQEADLSIRAANTKPTGR
jgi:hypothetical protein